MRPPNQTHEAIQEVYSSAGYRCGVSSLDENSFAATVLCTCSLYGLTVPLTPTHSGGQWPSRFPAIPIAIDDTRISPRHERPSRVTPDRDNKKHASSKPRIAILWLPVPHHLLSVPESNCSAVRRQEHVEASSWALDESCSTFSAAEIQGRQLRTHFIM